MIGYCPVCDKLVTIVPRGLRENGKDCRYFPIPHDYKNSKCEGDKREIK